MSASHGEPEYVVLQQQLAATREAVGVLNQSHGRIRDWLFGAREVAVHWLTGVAQQTFTTAHCGRRFAAPIARMQALLKQLADRDRALKLRLLDQIRQLAQTIVLASRLSGSSLDVGPFLADIYAAVRALELALAGTKALNACRYQEVLEALDGMDLEFAKHPPFPSRREDDPSA